jgi:phosphatase NudJ
MNVRMRPGYDARAMSRDAIPTHSFALVLVRKGDRFALVHERKHGEGWYLPGGRVDPGESWAQAAVRETMEEAGLAVVLDGVLKIQHTPGDVDRPARVRVFFLAHPAPGKEDAPLKSVADEHSLEAAWVTADEAERLNLRGDEVVQWLRYVLEGPVLAPLSILTREVP